MALTAQQLDDILQARDDVRPTRRPTGTGEAVPQP